MTKPLSRFSLFGISPLHSTGSGDNCPHALAKVQADPDLYPVVAMLITELSLDLFRKFPDAVKYIALDEA